VTARIEPFVDVLLRERAEQLYLLPDEPVTIVSGGRPRKVTRQPLTDRHIYALLMDVAPSDAADRIDRRNEAAFEYAAGRGLVRVRVIPEGTRLTAVISPVPAEAQGTASRGRPPAAAPPPSAPRPSAIAAAPFVSEPVPGSLAPPAAPAALPGEFAASQYSAAEQRLRQLLAALVAAGGSDLHLRVNEPPAFRKHGELSRHGAPPVSGTDLELMLLAVMPEADRVTWKETGDADFAYEVQGLARFRCNAARERRGPAAVIRVVPAHILGADELGIPEAIQRLCRLQRGLILVSGPTGSGKSTTLGALVDLINRERAAHIVTIEDPIEFIHESRRSLVTQRQVRLHTAGTAAALRAALREDPDVVVIGELGDLDTLTLALETAETGHLVLSTMRTTSATGTIDQIIDRFPPDRQAHARGLLADALKGVVSQALCRKVGGGRVVARETVIVTQPIAHLIREGKTFQIPAIMHNARKTGMQTLNDALLELVELGQVEPQEAWLRSVERAPLENALKAKGMVVGE
jgi:twitching motility protein PilT